MGRLLYGVKGVAGMILPVEPPGNESMEIDVGERADSPVSDSMSAGATEDWAKLVERIHRGDTAAMEDLYRTFSKGIRYLLCRQLGPVELDDKVHDIFVIVVQAITRGELREPDRLMGFVRTVVRRQVANHIDKAVQVRRGQVDLDPGLPVSDDRVDPEKSFALNQRIDLMQEVLRGISVRDREILTRFYLEEQSQETICSEMRLSDTQFRLLKSRAKARFAELGKKKLVRKSLSTYTREAGR
jgi:RNA polymerase sigma-70 factor, ECF subfamily